MVPGCMFCWRSVYTPDRAAPERLLGTHIWSSCEQHRRSILGEARLPHELPHPKVSVKPQEEIGKASRQSCGHMQLELEPSDENQKWKIRLGLELPNKIPAQNDCLPDDVRLPCPVYERRRLYERTVDTGLCPPLCGLFLPGSSWSIVWYYQTIQTMNQENRQWTATLGV